MMVFWEEEEEEEEGEIRSKISTRRRKRENSNGIIFWQEVRNCKKNAEGGCFCLISKFEMTGLSKLWGEMASAGA